MKIRVWIALAGLSLMAAGLSCSRSVSGDAELMRFPLDSLAGVITQSGIELDRAISSDGRGSVKIAASEPGIFRLFELGDIDIEEAILVYQAKLRTENVDGLVYLEMLCHFEGKGEYFSRGLDSPLKGTVEWTTQEIPFYLKKGENPDNVKLNLVCEGRGTVWVDNVRLIKRKISE